MFVMHEDENKESLVRIHIQRVRMSSKYNY